VNDLKQLKKSFNLAAFAASFDAPTFLTPSCTLDGQEFGGHVRCA
jgi:hypothetical protein